MLIYNIYVGCCNVCVRVILSLLLYGIKHRTQIELKKCQIFILFDET